MARKPRRVYNAALGRMVSADDYTESPVTRPDTSRKPVGQKVYSDGTDVDRLSITQQVVEHPAAQKERLESAAGTKFGELLHSIYDAVLLTDMDGIISEVNARSEFLLKWTREELLGVNVVDLISGADETLLDVVRGNVKNRKFTVLEAICLRNDGSRFNADIVVNKLKSHERRTLCFFIRDVTARKQAEDDLKNANNMLVEAEKIQARVDTISTLLHAFNNPLQILTCMAEMDENQEYKKQLDRIVTLLDQLQMEQSLDEIIDEDGSSRYSIEEPRDEVPANMDAVLVVDDEDTLRGMFVDALTSALPGKTIDPAADGRVALDLFMNRHHGIVVMDISMPLMNGEQAFEEIRQYCEQKSWEMPRVIFCTGFTISESIQALVMDGSEHMCLQKPLSLSSLIDAVKSRLPA